MKKPVDNTNYSGVFTNILLCGIFASLVYLCASVPSSISSINAKFVQPEILKRFPENQAELTIRQFLSIIENVHKISSKSTFLTEQNIAAFVGDAKTIVERLSNLLERNTTDALMRMVEQINRIPMRKVAESLSHLDLGKINQLAESTRLIEEKLNKLHEIKIQI